MGQVVQATVSTLREAKAKRIRELMQFWSENAVKLGLELIAAQETFEIGPRGQRMGWEKWLKAEIGIKSSHAYNLIRIGKKFGDDLSNGVGQVAGRVLLMLTREATPEAAKKEVLTRARQGEPVDTAKAKSIIKKHLPPPKEANKTAKQTGKPTLASDGYLYLGGDEKQVKESTERRTVVYAVRRAVETLAKMETTPTAFIEIALPHQLWTEAEEHQIEEAAKWLNALKAAWAMRK